MGKSTKPQAKRQPKFTQSEGKSTMKPVDVLAAKTVFDGPVGTPIYDSVRRDLDTGN